MILGYLLIGLGTYISSALIYRHTFANTSLLRILVAFIIHVALWPVAVFVSAGILKD